MLKEIYAQIVANIALRRYVGNASCAGLKIDIDRVMENDTVFELLAELNRELAKPKLSNPRKSYLADKIEMLKTSFHPINKNTLVSGKGRKDFPV